MWLVFPKYFISNGTKQQKTPLMTITLHHSKWLECHQHTLRDLLFYIALTHIRPFNTWSKSNSLIAWLKMIFYDLDACFSPYMDFKQLAY